MSFFGIEFDLKIVAAILTIVGYSINDTIVTYDRIRENIGTTKGRNYIQLINKSVNETLARTILTSLTVVLVVFVLFFFGGEVIHGFSFVLLVGLIAGTYSTIYIASPIVLLWDKSPGKKLSAASSTDK
jgi:preprotein translocase subunit SecF